MNTNKDMVEPMNGIKHIFCQKIKARNNYINGFFEINLPFVFSENTYFGNTLYKDGMEFRACEISIVLNKRNFSHIQVILEDCNLYDDVPKDDVLKMLKGHGWKIKLNQNITYFDNLYINNKTLPVYSYKFSLFRIDKNKKHLSVYMNCDLPFFIEGNMKLIQECYNEPQDLCVAVSTEMIDSNTRTNILDESSQLLGFYCINVSVTGKDVFIENIDTEYEKLSQCGWSLKYK